jgi:hypothetical protein
VNFSLPFFIYTLPLAFSLSGSRLPGTQRPSYFIPVNAMRINT